MWKWWSHSMSPNNIHMVSVTGRYLITQKHNYQTGNLAILHYTALASVLWRNNLIGSFQMSHRNTTHSTQKLISFKLTIFHAIKLFSNIQKCHSSYMPCKVSWHTCAAVPHTTIFSVTTKHHNHHKQLHQGLFGVLAPSGCHNSRQCWHYLQFAYFRLLHGLAFPLYVQLCLNITLLLQNFHLLVNFLQLIFQP